MDVVDLNKYARDYTGYYGGRSGSKYALIIDGARWMVKFPENTRDFPGREKPTHHIPSYTTSPLSEFLGSQVYELLGVPVHQTLLGVRDGKIVVACKDFDPMRNMVVYGDVKNSVVESEAALSSSSSSSKGEPLSDVLQVLKAAPLLARTPGVEERFWDMFVVDGLIRNNDRNNGNWGFFVNADGSGSLAPVFDNGNAFFNKRNPSVAVGRLGQPSLVEQDALGTGTSFFLDGEGRHIHPFELAAKLEHDGCTQALVRLARRVDWPVMRAMVQGVPEEAFGLLVISAAQKAHYLAMMETVLRKGVLPVVARVDADAAEALQATLGR